MKIKKLLALTIASLTLISMSACSKETTSSSVDTDQTYQYTKYIDTDTPYTMCYQNTDGTYTMFIYAAPVQYFDGEMYQPIDNTIIESDRENFAYENKANSIKTYFPKKISDGFLIERENFSFNFNIDTDSTNFTDGKLTDYTNIYGQSIKAVCYNSENYSLYFYVSNAGIEIDTVSDKGITETPEILIDYDNNYGKARENYKNGYIALRRGNGFNDIDAVIYGPLCRTDDNYEIELTPNINEVGEDQWGITYNFDVEQTKINQAIVLYTSNMPDSCAYSEFSQNQYLARFAYVGSSNLFGEGLDYLRYRLDYYLYLNPDNVIDASYNFKVLSDASTDKFVVNENLDQWSSTGLSWKNRNTKFSEVNATCTIVENGYYSLNITDYAKKCFADETWMTESYGIALGYDGDMQVVASSDNSMFIPYLQIDLSAMPEEFYPMEDINPE